MVCHQSLSYFYPCCPQSSYLTIYIHLYLLHGCSYLSVIIHIWTVVPSSSLLANRSPYVVPTFRVSLSCCCCCCCCCLPSFFATASFGAPLLGCFMTWQNVAETDNDSRLAQKVYPFIRWHLVSVYSASLLVHFVVDSYRAFLSSSRCFWRLLIVPALYTPTNGVSGIKK